MVSSSPSKEETSLLRLSLYFYLHIGPSPPSVDNLTEFIIVSIEYDRFLSILSFPLHLTASVQSRNRAPVPSLSPQCPTPISVPDFSSYQIYLNMSVLFL